MNNFSYLEYKNIIEKLQINNEIKDFSEINNKTKKFLLIRHDVEFSPERALQMAEYEKNMMGINSSYFFQFRNSCYNMCSYKNLKILERIINLGHKIGLHVHKNGNQIDSVKNLKKYIISEINIFSKLIDYPIDRFSFHRPTNFELSSNIKIKEKINVYSNLYFHFFNNKKIFKPKIKYFSDSLHTWNYGNPIVDKKKYLKIQILTHPYSWSIFGSKNTNNLKNLIQENKKIFTNDLSKELKYFPKI